MGFGVLICFVVAARAMNPRNTAPTEITFNNEKQIAERKLFGTGKKFYLFGLKNPNASLALPLHTDDEQTPANNFTDIVLQFVNSSICNCGTEKAKEKIPIIKLVLKGIFKLPFVQYLIDENTQNGILKQLTECAERPVTARERRKRKKSRNKHRNRSGDMGLRAFFTGAIVNGGESEESKKTMTIKFKSILDDILKTEGAKLREESKQALMKLILELDRLRKSKNSELHTDDGSANGEDKGASPNKDTDEDDDASLTSDNKEFRANDGNGSTRGAASDEIVIDHNMEISVRMNGGKAD
ncbi:unnamed protein product, partial [Iphiclides podalirius]